MTSIQWTTFNRCVPMGRWSMGQVRAGETVEADQQFAVNGKVIPQSGLDTGAVDLSVPLTGKEGFLYLGSSSTPLFYITQFEAYPTINTKDVPQLGDDQIFRAITGYTWDLTMHRYEMYDADILVPVLTSLANNTHLEFTFSAQLLVPVFA